MALLSLNAWTLVRNGSQIFKFSDDPTLRQARNLIWLRPTDAEVFDHGACVPNWRLVGARRLYFQASQLHPLAGHNTGRVAGERVDSPVFFVSNSHSVFRRLDT